MGLIAAFVSTLSGLLRILTTEGDILFRNATTVTRLARGADNEVLTATATTVGWEAAGGGALTFAKIVKTTDETVANSTVLQDDDVLLFTPTINRTYNFMLLLLFNAPATPDLKYAFSVPAGATINGMTNNTVGVTATSSWTDLTADQVVTGSVGADATVFVTGRIVMGATAGAVTLQWAQNTSNAAATAVLAGAMLIVWEQGST